MNRLTLLSRAVTPTIARRGVHAGQVVSPPKRFMSFEQQLMYWGFLFTLSMTYPTYILMNLDSYRKNPMVYLSEENVPDPKLVKFNRKLPFGN